MTSRIGAKGPVVIPKAIRDRANLRPGDEVDIEWRHEQVVLVARRSPARLGGRFAKSGMAARLLVARAGEAMRACLDSWAILAWLDRRSSARTGSRPYAA